MSVNLNQKNFGLPSCADPNTLRCVATMPMQDKNWILDMLAAYGVSFVSHNLEATIDACPYEVAPLVGNDPYDNTTACLLLRLLIPVRDAVRNFAPDDQRGCLEYYTDDELYDKNLVSCESLAGLEGVITFNDMPNFIVILPDNLSEQIMQIMGA